MMLIVDAMLHIVLTHSNTIVTAFRKNQPTLVGVQMITSLPCIRFVVLFPRLLLIVDLESSRFKRFLKILL